MAPKPTQPAPNLLPPSSINVLNGFLEAAEFVQQQLREGKLQPILPITKVAILGADGLSLMKKHLQTATNTELDFTINANINSIIVTPIGPLRATESVPMTSTVKAATTKVPRPPNAFILYRKEWHPIVVSENRNLHNNEISVILGKKWHSESEAVKDSYRQKAEDAKRQHALDHPEYQYQPRKSFEKKRRMTKKKLANLAAQAKQIPSDEAAQQKLPLDFDPFTLLDDSLDQIVQPFEINSYGTVWYDESPMLQVTTAGTFDLPMFEAGLDEDELLAQQLSLWNEQYTTSSEFVPLMGIPTTNGKTVGRYDRMDIPDAEFYQLRPSAPTSTVAPAHSATLVPRNNHNPLASIQRQDRLEFEAIFNYNSTGQGNVNTADAANAMNAADAGKLATTFD